MADPVDDPMEAERALAAAFDPAHLAPAFYEDPYPTYRALQRHAPRRILADGSVFLSAYADLDAIYRDRESFSSDKREAFAPRFGTNSPLYAHHTTSLVFNDAPYHTRVRRHVVGALSPATLKAMGAGLAALVDALCDALEDRGEVDLVAHFAAAIPVEVIGNLLGIPASERGPLRAWSLAILAALDPAPTPAMLVDGNRSVAEFLDYTELLIDERRRHLRGPDDLLSRLIRDDADNAPLTASEVQHNCIFLLNAGHETTTNLIANGLALLLSHPEAAERLRAEPALAASAVEECLRYESPNQLGNRLVTRAVELGDVTLEPGTYLTLCIGAANRDPAAFADADRFDVGRAPNRHLSFAAGAHACAGMNVARLEGQLALARFLERFPRARLLPGARRARRARFRGFEVLPADVR